MRELKGWKEIATHLGVNIRTAQKWERDRGLPVRRLPGGHGRVAADPASLDAWRHQPALAPEGTTFRWPVDHDMIAEVRFLGGSLTSEHVQRLLAHLSLIKTALD